MILLVGAKVVIKFANIVKGDGTGDGISIVSDVEKLYQYLKVKIEIEDYYLFAGNVVNIDNEINNIKNILLYKIKIFDKH